MSEAVAGQLEAFGLEEIEPGVVADTIENRQRLKLNAEGYDWERLRNEDGELNGLLRVITPEERTQERLAPHKLRKPILVDPEDPWSDYVHPDDYPLDVWMPWWVEMRLRAWREQAREGVPEEERRTFPRRCTQLRTDNTRCWQWASNPDKVSVCKSHTHQTRESITQMPVYARERLLEASVNAVDNLIYLSDHAEGEAVRLKANTEILDRSGVRAGVDIDISAHIEEVDPAKKLRDRLTHLTARATSTSPLEEEPTALPAPTNDDATEIVEAEIVEDER